MGFINGGDLTTKLETANELTVSDAGKIIADGQPLDAQINFNSRGLGTMIDSIDGYPDDLPRLQIMVNPDGSNPRLCFWDYPVFTQNLKNWVDYTKVSGANQLPVLTTPKFFVDWNPMNTYGSKRAATPAQMQAEKAAYCVGRVYVAPGDSSVPTVLKNRPATINDAIANMATPKVPGTQTISALPVDRLFWYGGQTGYIALYPWQWIFENVQHYVNRYLTVPYVVTDLIPYGSNWQLQFQNATTGRNYNKVLAYLNGCNFLMQPIGKQDFWDKFYLAVPILISTVAALESGGAAAPALIAAIGAIVKKGEASTINTANATTNVNAQKDSTTNQKSTQIKLDDLLGSNLTSFEFFAICAILIILLLSIFYFSKK